MKIEILTIFPKMFEGPFSQSLLQRAQKNKLVSINIHNLRDWTKDKHKTVDDKPFGGGPGMVMKVTVVARALKKLKQKNTKVILLTPQGKQFKQFLAKELAKQSHLIFICGHYEGFDERIRKLIDEEISIGDYILTGGEIPAMVIVDTVVRLLPGTVGNKDSIKDESFSRNLLEYPQYTRPAEFNNMKVPEVLISGNHQEITKWRQEQSIKRTKSRRPELIKK